LRAKKMPSISQSVLTQQLLIAPIWSVKNERPDRIGRM
jgi:hypothetical protein